MKPFPANSIDFICLAAIGQNPNRWWAIILGILFAVVTVSLLIASWTKWGQTKALTKCVALAFLAHVWLLLYAYGTLISSPGIGGGTGGGIASEGALAVIEIQSEVPDPLADLISEPTSESDSTDSDDTNKLESWETPITESIAKQVDAPELPKLEVPTLLDRPKPVVANFENLIEEPRAISMEEIIAMTSEEPASPTPAIEPSTLPDTTPSSVALPIAPLTEIKNVATSPALPVVPVHASAKPQPLVEAYQMRLSPLKSQFAYQNGGDGSTESAVEQALAWLAREQSPDGSWNAATHEAGREPPANRAPADGRYRSNTGLRANTAMTGLAILSFLGAGHTHAEGQYADNVTRGLRYLVQQQFPSGDLSGRDQVGQEPSVRYARMYSHGIAAIALSEAYAMTGDRSLLGPIQSAAKYTSNAMNPRTGGWRYEIASDDPGDTSQFGWQAMFLNSASASGAIQLTGNMRSALERFLDSVSTGRSGGLAVYRNVSPQLRPDPTGASPAMTSEAIAMRMILRFSFDNAAAHEATELMMLHLPGTEEENLYYWYYATIALYQLRGTTSQLSPEFDPKWVRWNEALKRQLCATQIGSGKEIGSWDPNGVWGSYGGRVYSTALACMSLEVYYRYLPIYGSATKVATRP